MARKIPEGISDTDLMELTSDYVSPRTEAMLAVCQAHGAPKDPNANLAAWMAALPDDDSEPFYRDLLQIMMPPPPRLH